MSDVHILSETRERVLYVTINRVEKHNALAISIIDTIGETFRAAAKDDALVAAVLRGAGEKTFAAGGDLRELAALRTAGEAETMARDAKTAFNAIRDFPVPVIAGLNGNAFGGGAELAVSCDFRVAANHARIGFVQGRRPGSARPGRPRTRAPADEHWRDAGPGKGAGDRPVRRGRRRR